MNTDYLCLGKNIIKNCENKLKLQCNGSTLNTKYADQTIQENYVEILNRNV